MKKLYKTLFAISLSLLLFGNNLQAQFCDNTGNVVIFSNYDGGVLTINVDQNIPNLKIGVVGYENDSIIVTGTYKNNIKKIVFAGYFNSNNKHCAPYPKKKSINGAPIGTDTIIFYPASTYTNSFGWASIICCTSCVINSSQGGCNTADQIADYFFKLFGSTKLYFHKTQYGCWTNTQNISAGGNCCAVPAGVGITKNLSDMLISVTPNPSKGKFSIETFAFTIHNLEVTDILGKVVFQQTEINNNRVELNLSTQPKGVYLLTLSDDKNVITKKLVIE